VLIAFPSALVVEAIFNHRLSRTTQRRWLLPQNTCVTHLCSSRAGALWSEALVEAGLTEQSVSSWAKRVPKLPRTWVEKVTQLNHTKLHNINFVGKVQGVKRREWVVNFARRNFGPDDFFRATTPAELLQAYQPLGAFDHTIDGAKETGWHEDLSEMAYRSFFDEEYYQVLSSSNFTLCPGGGRPFSIRFYEAILAGSIPVIFSEEADLAPVCSLDSELARQDSSPSPTPSDASAPTQQIPSFPCPGQALREIGYRYHIVNSHDPLEYREEWAKGNLELFMKYQTFISGDNVPPGVTEQ